MFHTLANSLSNRIPGSQSLRLIVTNTIGNPREFHHKLIACCACPFHFRKRGQLRTAGMFTMSRCVSSIDLPRMRERGMLTPYL
jgi:hypothetical protein